MYLHRLVAIAILSAVSTAVSALDTDIYLTPTDISRDDSPNVLIILDNSGSMDEIVSSRPAYDPNTNYSTVAGSPGLDTSRVYWSTGGSPPGKGTDQWFSVTNNNCEASKPVLAASGIYGGVKIVAFKASGEGKGWRALQAGADRTTDCSADDGASDPKGYVKSSNKNPLAAYTNVAADQINWGGVTSTPTLYSANYMNYWHNTTLSTSQTRMQIAKNVVNGIIDANRNLRLGLMVFNYGGEDDTDQADSHGGRLLMKVDTMTDARRTAMKNVVNSLTASTWTPLTETLWEAMQYIGGRNIDYGNNDTAASPARDTTAENAGKYISPLLYSCQKGFIILVTDGDPTVDGAANAKIAALSGIGTLSGSRLDELAGWMANNDVNTNLNGNQTVVTYTVSFGTGISASGLSLLQATASKGGGEYKTAENADELTDALQSAISEIMTTTSSFVAPSLSVNAFNRLFNRDDVYFAMFKPSDTQRWDGNVKKFTLNVTGDIVDAGGTPAIDITTQRIKDSARSFWGNTTDGGTVTAGGVGAQIPVPASRKLYTYRGSYSGLSAASPGTLTPITATAGNAFYDAMVAAPSLLGLSSTATASEVKTLVEWMTGLDSYDQDGNTSTVNRWALSDPLHSRPVAITYGGTDANPVIKLFVATNDGAIHMVNDKTGVEEWSFIPQENEILSKQFELSQDPPGLHPHLMDGTPTFWIQDNNGNGVIEPEIATGKNDKLYMFIGQRRGGRNIYAFDVTPSATLTDPSATGGVVPKLIWVIRGGVDADYLSLGQTWSRPALTKIRYACTSGVCAAGDNESKWVLIFGGGYDPNQDTSYFPASSDAMGNAIYIVDPLSGKRLWWASGSTDSAGNSPTLTVSGMVFSIPSDLALIDTNADNAVDRIYVGDVSGQIWRLDLSPTLKLNTNAGSTGYRFADVACTSGSRPTCAGTPAQDRRKFFYPPDFAQVTDSNFSSTPNYDIVVIGSGDREDPLDRLTVTATPAEPVHNRLYMFRDYRVATGPAATPFPSALTHAQLFDATSNVLQSPSDANYAAALTSLKGKSGWYIDLASSGTPTWIGEKNLSRPVIYAGAAYFTTYVPANSSTAATTCAKDEGLGKLYNLNVLNATANYDYDADTTLETSERSTVVGGGIPSELVVVIRQSGVSGLIGTSGGAAKPAGIPTALPRARTYWHEE